VSMDNINIVFYSELTGFGSIMCTKDIHGQVSIDTQSTSRSIHDGLPDQYLDDTQFRPTLDQQSVESQPNVDRLYKRMENSRLSYMNYFI